MDKESKIFHDLALLYLEKNVQSFEDVKTCFNQYIKTKNEFLDLHYKYLHKDDNEYFEDHLKLMDNFIE